MKHPRDYRTKKKVGKRDDVDDVRLVEIKYGNDSYSGRNVGVEYRGKYYILSMSKRFGGDYVIYLERIKKGLIAKNTKDEKAVKDIKYKQSNLERALNRALTKGRLEARVNMPIIFKEFMRQ